MINLLYLARVWYLMSNRTIAAHHDHHHLVDLSTSMALEGAALTWTL